MPSHTPELSRLPGSASGSPQYNFTTVESSEGGRSGPEGEGTWSVTVSSLDPHTDYHVVVQAYNTEGAGPLSPPATVTTREDGEEGPVWRESGPLFFIFIHSFLSFNGNTVLGFVLMLCKHVNHSSPTLAKPSPNLETRTHQSRSQANIYVFNSLQQNTP